MIKKILLVFIALSTFLIAKEVTVSILPQKYFVEKIAGDKFKVNVMVMPGTSPHNYEPKTSQMRRLSKSSAYFSIDVSFEDIWLEKFKSVNKNMIVIDTTKGIKKIEMQAHEHEDEKHEEHEDAKHDEHEHEKHDEHEDAKHDEHEHEKHDEHEDAKHDEHDEHEHEDEKHDEHEHEKHDEHEDAKHDEHDHTGLDPHIWLDPVLVKTQAKNILDALVKIDKNNKEFYEKNYVDFLKELDILDKKIETILEPFEHKAFMVFHPSWGYFAKRYHLEQISIEVEGKEPKPAQLIELVDEAKKHAIKIVFVSPQFSQRSAKTISKSINGNVLVINPLSNEWDKNLIKVATDIANTYK